MDEFMLTEEQIAQFQNDGFLKGGQVLSDEQVEELRDELDRVIRDEAKEDIPQPVRIANLSGNENSPVWQVVNIWEASPAYERLIRNSDVLEGISRLMGARQLRVWHDQIQYKPAETGGVNKWHQDSPYWPILQPKTEQVSAWFALDDVDETNGCMRMVTGSHKWGNQIEFLHTLNSLDDMPAEFKGHALEVRLCPVAKGEVHFHHSLTWHSSHENRSGRPRRAIAVHFMTEKTTYDESSGHCMKPFVEADVKNGEVLRGEHFPLVWETGA